MEGNAAAALALAAAAAFAWATALAATAPAAALTRAAACALAATMITAALALAAACALALATAATRAACALAAATLLGGMTGSAGKQASFDGAPGQAVEDLEALGDGKQFWPGRELSAEIQDLEAPEAGAAHLYQITPVGSGTQGAAAPAHRAERNSAGEVSLAAREPRRPGARARAL